MNLAGLFVLAVILIIDNFAFSLIIPRRQVFYACSAWKQEYYTSCYVAECEETCDNRQGICPIGFHIAFDNCRPGCVCAPGFVRDQNGICTVASFVCSYQDLADSFSRDPVWSDPLASSVRKNRRRRLRYI